MSESILIIANGESSKSRSILNTLQTQSLPFPSFLWEREKVMKVCLKCSDAYSRKCVPKLGKFLERGKISPLILVTSSPNS